MRIEITPEMQSFAGDLNHHAEETVRMIEENERLSGEQLTRAQFAAYCIMVGMVLAGGIDSLPEVPIHQEH